MNMSQGRGGAVFCQACAPEMHKTPNLYDKKRYCCFAAWALRMESRAILAMLISGSYFVSKNFYIPEETLS